MSENIKFICRALETCRICPVSQRVQMNFIFSDNAHILYLSCNVKKQTKTNAKLSKKSRNKRHSSFSLFLMMSSVKSSALVLFPFLTITQHESHTRKIYISWSVKVYSKHLSSRCNFAAQIKPVQDKIIYN